MKNPCPCGSSKTYAQCCALLHNGAPAPNAEALMRSRYSAFAMELHDYLRSSWHVSTRPPVIDTGHDRLHKTHWTGLRIVRHEPTDDTHALVEFIARYKINGRAFALHESSRFVREHGHWFYVEGDIT